MSIAQKCKVEGCKLLGHKKPNGDRYFPSGFCGAHYKRSSRGLSPYELLSKDKRPAIIEGDIAKIPLGLHAKDGYAIVDKEFAWLDKYNWSKHKTGYACANKKTADGYRMIKMHRYVMNEPNAIIDHINHDTLDNRSTNLREVTPLESAVNRRSYGKASIYKGVTKQKNRWIAHCGGSYLGMYKDETDAAIIYNIVAEAWYGNIAVLNYTDKTPHNEGQV